MVKNKERSWGGGVTIRHSAAPYPYRPLQLKHGIRTNDYELITLTRHNTTPALQATKKEKHLLETTIDVNGDFFFDPRCSQE